MRSPNQSFDVLGGGPGSTSGAPRVVSVDNLLRRMEDKGVKIDRSRVESNLSAASRDSVFQRGRRERCVTFIRKLSSDVNCVMFTCNFLDLGSSM